MKDMWIVARWEFNRSIRSKVFLIITLLVPAIMVLAGFIPQYIAGKVEHHIVIVDDAGGVYEAVGPYFEAQGVRVERGDLSPAELQDEARREVNKNKNYLYIPGDFYAAKQAQFYFHGAPSAGDQSMSLILDQVAKAHDMQSLGLSQAQIAKIQSPVKIQQVPIDKRAGGDMSKLLAGQVMSIGFTFLVVFVSMMSGAILLQSIIAEKNDKIVEILLSSVSSRALMGGKIVATLLIGLVQVVILGAMGLFAAKFIFTNFSVKSILNISLLYALIYGILAFIQIAALYAFLGSVMKEAQSGGQSQTLLGILPIVPIWFLPVIMADPFSTISRVLSFLPPFTPLTMVIRTAMVPIPFWEVGLSMVLLVLFDLWLIHFVAKIFKTGLLMYGKDTGIKEAWRWFKQASG